jgi:3-hydroxyacyl-CoA dehydrogenase/enoyl-CoA hydratase/carnithine racemase
MTSSSSSVCSFRVSGSIGLIELCNGDGDHGATVTLTPALLSSLESTVACLEKMAAAELPRVVLIFSSQPSSFCHGADVGSLLGPALDDGVSPATTAAEVLKLHGLFRRLRDLPCPTCAVVDGPALGGGLELLLNADHVFATERARFGVPEVMLGIIPSAGGCGPGLTERVGYYRASRMVASGETYSAFTALRLGLVDGPLLTAEEAGLHPEQVVAARMLSGAFAPRKRPRGAAARPLTSLLPRPVRQLGQGLLAQVVHGAIARGVLQKTKGRFEAPLRALEAVSRIYFGAPADAVEASIFSDLVSKTTSRSIIASFLERSRAKAAALAYGLVEAGGPAPGASSKPGLLVVLGAGYMGSGIAHWALACGLDVALVDPSQEALDQAHGSITAELSKGDGRKVGGGGGGSRRLTLLPSLAELAKRHAGSLPAGAAILECAPESLELKLSLAAQFAELAVLSSSSSSSAVPLFFTNTSSLSVGAVSGGAGARAGSVCGLHFFSPKKNVTAVTEVVVSATSDASTVRAAAALSVSLKKCPVLVFEVPGMQPGFVVNRVAAAMYFSAAHLVLEGHGVEAVDAAVEAWGFPLGPFALMDGISISTMASVLSSHKGGDPEKDNDGSLPLRRLIDQLVASGCKGRKPDERTSMGFFRWDQGKRGPPNRALADSLPALGAAKRSKEEIQEIIVLSMINAAAEVAGLGVTRRWQEVDFLLVSAMGWPVWTSAGPLSYFYAHREYCLARMNSLAAGTPALAPLLLSANRHLQQTSSSTSTSQDTPAQPKRFKAPLIAPGSHKQLLFDLCALALAAAALAVLHKTRG